MERHRGLPQAAISSGDWVHLEVSAAAYRRATLRPAAGGKKGSQYLFEHLLFFADTSTLPPDNWAVIFWSQMIKYTSRMFFLSFQQQILTLHIHDSSGSMIPLHWPQDLRPSKGCPYTSQWKDCYMAQLLVFLNPDSLTGVCLWKSMPSLFLTPCQHISSSLGKKRAVSLDFIPPGVSSTHGSRHEDSMTAEEIHRAFQKSKLSLPVRF